MKPLIYLGGPITGLAYNGATAWRAQFMEDHARIFRFLNPMRNKDHLQDAESLANRYPEGGFEHEIYKRDTMDIRRADGLFINFLDAGVVSKGTVWEHGFATALEKPIVIVMEKDNVHDGIFTVCAHTTRVERTMSAGLRTLKEIFNV